METNPTMKEWLHEWYDVYAKPNVKQSTAVSYECYIRKHIVPALGDIPLSDVKLGTFQKFFNDEAQKYSPKTVSNLRMMFHTAMKIAYQNDLISKNYIEFVKIPTVRTPEMRVFTIAEQKKLTDELKRTDEQFAIGIFLCLTTGIRVGELCGLQWKHIDFENNNLMIRQTVQRLPKLDYNGKGNKTEIVIGSPKSQASERDIPLDDKIIEKLLDYKNKMEQMHGSYITASDEFLITSKRGTPTEPRTMQDSFKRIISAAGITDANFHALRHTFATRALEAGVDFKTLSILLGHSDIIVTMNHYAHVLNEPKRAAMKNITSIILQTEE
ncbi:MAG: site-specific integrase [Ruminococcus sp.]|nr:site-specific integrase [Ruminococcus sp.]